MKEIIIKRMVDSVINHKTGRCIICKRKNTYCVCSRCWSHPAVKKMWVQALDRIRMLNKLDNY